MRDFTRAYVWFSVAAARGEEGGTVGRDQAAEELSRTELLETQALASKCFESGGEDCPF